MVDKPRPVAPGTASEGDKSNSSVPLSLSYFFNNSCLYGNVSSIIIFMNLTGLELSCMPLL